MKHVPFFSEKILGQQAFHLFQLLFSCSASYVASLSKQGHVNPKACHTGFQYTSPSIFAHYAIPTSSTRRRLLSTWKYVQEHTQNLRWWSLSVWTASNPLIYMTKLRITLIFTSWDRLETCIICLNNFNNLKELISNMNISSWADFELPVQRPIRPYCQQTFETNKKLRTTFVFTSNGNKLYEICFVF